MFTEKNLKIVKEKNTNYFRISNKDFILVRSENSMSKEEFIALANKTYIERFGKEPVYMARNCTTRSKEPTDPYMKVIRNRWASLNQRCVNGEYKNSESVTKNFQQFSYHKKGITLDMTKDEFFAWMLSVKPIHDEIVSNGDRSSINRIDSRKGYSVDNIELISIHKNIEERYGFDCKRMTEEELTQKSIFNHNRYLNSQKGGN